MPRRAGGLEAAFRDGGEHADLDGTEAAATGEHESSGHETVRSFRVVPCLVPGRVATAGPRHGSVLEPVGELLDDPGGKRVGDLEDVGVDAVVGGDVACPVA